MSSQIQVVNGYQIVTHGATVAIMDLHSGGWARFSTYIDRKSNSPDSLGLIAGQTAAILAHPWLTRAIAEVTPLDDANAPVSVSNLVAAIGESAERPLPPYPVPSLLQLISIAYPMAWDRPCNETIDAIVAVVLALAWRQGRAYDFELEEDLLDWGQGRIAARSAMRTALWKTDRNISRDGEGGFAVWIMREKWIAFDVNREARPKTRSGVDLGSLFDDGEI